MTTDRAPLAFNLFLYAMIDALFMLVANCTWTQILIFQWLTVALTLMAMILWEMGAAARKDTTGEGVRG